VTKSTADLRALEAELQRTTADLARVRAAVTGVFLGHDDVVDGLMQALLAGGHVLLEGVPGLGKTTLAKSLAAALGMQFARVSFTPDLMPGDILGLRVLEEDERGRRLVLQRGPVFCNVLLADEINRATPRTQSALLEAMAEGQVTLFGETLRLPEPFLVVATQNPIELEGTWPLPEAQLDRFLVQLVLELPDAPAMAALLRSERDAPIAPALDAPRLVRARELCARVPASDDVLAHIARLVRATQPAAPEAPELVRAQVRHGAGPRGAQAVLGTARARALLAGRLHVSREDVAAVAAAALRHRLIPSFEGEAAGFDRDALVRAVLAHVERRS
jgi:MoxR-like ATPase